MENRLLLGTEDKRLLILEQAGNAVAHSLELPGIPSMIAARGVLDTDYRLAIACRGGTVVLVKV
jgi:hypothetical protein